MNRDTEAKKLAFFLPNTFTALNMGCGFACIIFAYQGFFLKACWVLLLGAIFDSVDGRVARMTGTQSSFGEQFDSISDVISFGVAPALLSFHRFFDDMGRAGLLFAFIYLLCGALRLARFNANIDRVSSDYFQGLPIPAGALAVVGYVLLSLEFKVLEQYPIIAGIYVVFYGLLMISNIPFFSFKSANWFKTHKKETFFVLCIFLALIFVYEQLMIGIVIFLYVIASLIYFFLHKGELKNIFEWKNENENEEGSA